MESILKLSATEMAAAVRQGQLSAVELTEAHIKRIEAINDKLNAVVIPLFEQARQQARAIDEKRKAGEATGALLGVPVTIKEQYMVAGTQTTLGATNKIGNVYHSEGPLVTKFREAGAVILGKTNIVQTLAACESDNRVYGRSNNPWNPERTPGGSSGGESAIIAARGSALGLAGDFGGSTRIPAHFCGLCGLKPTSGRLTNTDFPPDLLSTAQEVFIPQPGPIARTVEDVELAMKVFSETSFDLNYDFTPPVPWKDFHGIQIKDLRIGFYTDNGYFPAAPALRRAVTESADALRAMGAVVEPVEAPDAKEAVRIFLGALSSGGGKDYKKLLGKEKPIPQVRGMFQGMDTPPFIMKMIGKMMAARGQKYLSHMILSMQNNCPTEKYWQIVEARNAYRVRFLQILDDGKFDALICPPAAVPALTHGAAEHLFPAFTYVMVYNVLGAPAGVVPVTTVQPGEESDRTAGKDLAEITAQQVEKDSAGLPVGVQVVARHWREDVVLAVMAALEKHFRSQPNFPDVYQLD